PTYLLRRGNHETPGPEVEPGFLSVLCTSDQAASAGEAKPAGGTSRRGLAVAPLLAVRGGPARGRGARGLVERARAAPVCRGDVGQLRSFRRPTDASRTARVAGRGLCRARLAAQAPYPPADDLYGVPADKRGRRNV